MTDMAHDGDDEASIKQRALGRRRFQDLASSVVEESIYLLGEEEEGASETGPGSIVKKTPIAAPTIVVPGTDLLCQPAVDVGTVKMEESRTPSPAVLVVSAVDVPQDNLVSPPRVEFGSRNEVLSSSPYGRIDENAMDNDSLQKNETRPMTKVLAVVLASEAISESRRPVPDNSTLNIQGAPLSVIDDNKATKYEMEIGKIEGNDKTSQKEQRGPQAKTEAQLETRDLDVNLHEGHNEVRKLPQSPVEESKVHPGRVDMELVRNCQQTFIQFLSQHPMLAEKPGVETLLILKLQKLFSVVHQVEGDLQTCNAKSKEQKESLSQEFSTKLIVASRRKASRKRELQRSFEHAQKQTSRAAMESKLAVLAAFELRMRQLRQLRVQSERQSIIDLIAIPVPYSRSIREALRTTSLGEVNPSQIGAEVALLRAESTVLAKKLESMRAACDKRTADIAIAQMEFTSSKGQK